MRPPVPEILIRNSTELAAIHSMVCKVKLAMIQELPTVWIQLV